MRKTLYYAFLALTFLFFGVFFFYPVCHVLHGGLTDGDGYWTLFYLAEVFRNPVYRVGLLNALKIAVATTLVSILIALPLAWLADRFDFWGKRLLTGALLLPLILAPFVGAIGMQCIFGRCGAFNALLSALGCFEKGMGPDWFAGGFWGVVLLESLHLFPLLYLNLTASFANVDPMLLEAAADLGCTGFKRFYRVVLPLIMPGIFAGSSLVFIWSFTELGTPLMFNYNRCLPVQIFDGINDLETNPMPYALVVVMMAFSTLFYILARCGFGRKSYAMLTKAGHSGGGRRLSGMKAFPVILVFGAIGLFSLLPHVGVLGMSISSSWYNTVLPTGITTDHFEAALGHSLMVPSIINSLRYALMAVAVAMLLGVFAAVVIVRQGGRVGWTLDTLIMLPLAVPGLVLAFGYMTMSLRGNPFECINPIENPTILLVIAYAIRRLPYVVRAAVAGLQQTSVSYEEAAASLGAGPMRVFRRITAPLICANLIAGGILAFSFSMLEVSDSLILAQKPVFYPITRAIYDLSSLLGQGAMLASALGLWTMLFLGVSLLTASNLLGKKLGAMFRM